MGFPLSTLARGVLLARYRRSRSTDDARSDCMYATK
jgi:hypothetical protein